ncbi:C-type lectin-related protein 4 [Plakobranchus ocellatus]|uniref:C-type lectin-related protein 4 n=1 Tax=Plakobranchus ocellatus TaxID=259542 RepID=A0AAV4CM73_9GAST|nr:C-type lectin-related protein 4 [Plakobranchus ocellatus]
MNLSSRGYRVSIVLKMLIAAAALNVMLRLMREVDGITNAKFTAVSADSISPLFPDRLKYPGWLDVSSLLHCTQKTVTNFPASRGFLYNSTSGLCTPLLWLEGADADGALGIQQEEGTLYLQPTICPGDFQLLEFGKQGRVACLKDYSETTDYFNATAVCRASGAYLADVKTAEKLSLIQTVANRKDRWIGLDDIQEEGLHVWQIDGKNMTEEERVAVFPSNEPNDMHGTEDCIQFRQQTQMLNDKTCSVKYGFVCLLRRIASLRRSRVLQYRNAKGVILLDILPQGQCINAARHCSTLDRLIEAIRRKRPVRWKVVEDSQQGDLRLSGPPSGQGAGSGARTRDRRVPADAPSLRRVASEQSGRSGKKAVAATFFLLFRAASINSIVV